MTTSEQGQSRRREIGRVLALYIAQVKVIMAWTMADTSSVSSQYFYLTIGPKRRVKDDSKDFGQSK